MHLSLILAPAPPGGGPVIFADPAGVSVEALLAGLISQLGPMARAVFPLPDDTTRRHLVPPPLTRSRHADLWHALSADERDRALLFAGPTAAYLAPAVGAAARMVVCVRDPRASVSPPQGAWRSVLGAFPALDELPAETESEEERSRWRDRIRAETAGVELVRATDLGSVTQEVGAGLGLRPKVAARAGTAAMAAGRNPSRLRERPSHWVDEVLYSLSRAPEPLQPRVTGRRAGETSA